MCSMDEIFKSHFAGEFSFLHGVGQYEVYR